ncbi:MAG: 23S rRNA (uracil(1939)-C(5))-methyltransferase RlmD [Lachnospiraceae bacterium]|nr:23S rRNA (uracil(1939)-C(5))-methyltransferase RlmD [Lachnospiraceae bacterium]
MGCRVSGKCGGCRYSAVEYGKQLEKKQSYIRELLKDFGETEPIRGMEQPEHYRCKVHHVFGRTKKGEVLHGSYQAGTHRIIPSEDCLLEDQQCREIISSIHKLLRSFKIRIYDEDSGTGLLRHVMVRKGCFSGEFLVVLVLADQVFPGKNNFVKALTSLHPEITTIVLNINPKDTSMVLGKVNKTIYGPGFIRDSLCGRTFRISPASFYQVNPAQTEVLYETAIGLAELKGTETVIDAYCGIGTIGLCVASRAEKVIGIELNADAVKDAILNCKENQVNNYRVYQGDAGEFMEAMADAGEKADVVFMDPPRNGSTQQFMDAVDRLHPGKLVYISCGPEALKRDLEYLESMDYRVKTIIPVDMFPYTEHTEVVCCLERQTIEDRRRQL